jgi:molecular chaperone DnaK (HSP70)
VRLTHSTPLHPLCRPQLLGETMLGIDLGTTFSVAATCHRGQATVVPVRAGAVTMFVCVDEVHTQPVRRSVRAVASAA